MADYCCNNNMLEVVDDDVHRLLPLEIIKDIGIANADELRRIAILQELSSRLATVLGDAKEGSQDHRRLYPASWATNSYQHHHGPPQPQVYREVDSRGRIADGHVVNAQRAHAPSSFWNARMVGTGISLPRFALARLRQDDVVPPAKQAASKGTGVFLPRVQAYPDTTSGSRRLGPVVVQTSSHAAESSRSGNSGGSSVSMSMPRLWPVHQRSCRHAGGETPMLHPMVATMMSSASRRSGSIDNRSGTCACMN